MGREWFERQPCGKNRTPSGSSPKREKREKEMGWGCGVREKRERRVWGEPGKEKWERRNRRGGKEERKGRVFFASRFVQE
jgi:hypothetical protein